MKSPFTIRYSPNVISAALSERERIVPFLIVRLSVTSPCSLQMAKACERKEGEVSSISHTLLLLYQRDLIYIYSAEHCS